jgi:hypothetical protein
MLIYAQAQIGLTNKITIGSSGLRVISLVAYQLKTGQKVRQQFQMRAVSSTFSDGVDRPSQVRTHWNRSGNCLPNKRSAALVPSPIALLSVSENHAQSKRLRAFPHNDLSGEFLSETQKCRPIGKTHALSGLQRLRSPRVTEER